MLTDFSPWHGSVPFIRPLSIPPPTYPRKHCALRPQKPLRLIRDGEVGGLEFYIEHLFVTLLPPEWFCIKAGSCVSHFNVSLIVWAKSQDSVHKPQFLKRRERRAEADRTKVLLLTSQAPYRSATAAHRAKKCPQWHIYPTFQAHSATQVCTGIWQNQFLFETGLNP